MYSAIPLACGVGVDGAVAPVSTAFNEEAVLQVTGDAAVPEAVVAGQVTARALPAGDGVIIHFNGLHGDHAHGGVLDRGGAVAALGFSHLVGLPLGFHMENRQILPLVGEQNRVPNGHILAIGVHHDRKTEELACSQTMTTHNGLVVLLMHEAAQR